MCLGLTDLCLFMWTICAIVSGFLREEFQCVYTFASCCKTSLEMQVKLRHYYRPQLMFLCAVFGIYWYECFKMLHCSVCAVSYIINIMSLDQIYAHSLPFNDCSTHSHIAILKGLHRKRIFGGF